LNVGWGTWEFVPAALPRSADILTEVRDLTIDDVVNAYFDAEKYQDWAEGMSDYHNLRLDLLTALFECRLPPRDQHHPPRDQHHDVSDDERDRDSLVGVARNALNRAAEPLSPFGWYLEGGPGPLERRVWAQHKRKFETAEKALQENYRAIFRSALDILYPEASSRSFPRTVLFERGLPRTEPEELDFW
jgi:hypothetical protein